MARKLIEVYLYIVFSTKHRANIIHPEIEAELHRYIAGIIANQAAYRHRLSQRDERVNVVLFVENTMCR